MSASGDKVGCCWCGRRSHVDEMVVADGVDMSMTSIISASVASLASKRAITSTKFRQESGGSSLVKEWETQTTIRRMAKGSVETFVEEAVERIGSTRSLN